MLQRTRIAVARPQDWQGVRIFGYHRVTEEDDVYAVSPAVFRAHMECMLAAGVRPVSLAEALDLLRSPVDGRYACVTFDDGYLDNLELALPILEELRIPATIFVISDVLDGLAGYYWHPSPPPALHWEHVPRVLESGTVDLQSHSRTHPALTTLDAAALEDEVAGAKRRLEEKLSYPVTWFSYPAGLYSSREARFVVAAGYAAAVTTLPGVNTHLTERAELRRTMIYWRDSLADFRAKLDGALDRPIPLARSLQGLRVRRGG